MSGKYILMNDLDFEGADISMIGSTTNPFVGFFDGGNHTIKNIGLYSSTDEIGLFAQNEGTIQNLNIEGLNINNEFTKNVFSLKYGSIAVINKGTIQNVSVSGNITLYNKSTNTRNGDYYYVGGIVSYNYGVIENCAFQDGYLRLYTSRTDDYSTTSSIQHICLGGIAAYNQELASISNCLVNATISGRSLYNTTKSSINISGLVAYNNGSIESCLILSVVSAYETYYDVLTSTVAVTDTYGTDSNCYRYSNLTVTGGSGATTTMLNSTSFYSSNLCWDSSVWDYENLDFSKGLIVKLRHTIVEYDL